MSPHSLGTVCTITGLEEVLRRGSGWKQRGAAAAAPNSQCTRSEHRQGHNTDPRSHWGAAISPPDCLLSPNLLSTGIVSSAADWLTDRVIDWDKIDFASRESRVVWSPNSAMTSPAKFRKEKEIVAEYDTQVKGKLFFFFFRRLVCLVTE